MERQKQDKKYKVILRVSRINNKNEIYQLIETMPKILHIFSIKYTGCVNRKIPTKKETHLC